MTGHMEPTRSCACARCVAMCERNPGWPTPAEAVRLMDQGLASRLMLDWWEPDEVLPDGALILCPASVGHEGALAPLLDGSWFMPAVKGRCTFLQNGRCGIYAVRPQECRTAIHPGGGRPEHLVMEEHEAVAAQWATPEGRAAVARWRQETGCAEVPPCLA